MTDDERGIRCDADHKVSGQSVIFAYGRHMQVLIETPESVVRREENPRRRKRYGLGCTCRARRRENGHCPHTLAIFEHDIYPNKRRYVSVYSIPEKNNEPATDERPRIELERELVELRSRVAELEGAAA